MSTRCGDEKRAAGRNSLPRRIRTSADAAEEIAVVACARRELLLRVHRHRLRREDLEDCYSQATLELIANARGRDGYASREHIANALELRFLSRVRDCRRALSGRSPMHAALEQAFRLTHVGDDGVQVVDARPSVEAIVLARDELRSIELAAQTLTADQRSVIGSQVAGERCEACCARLGWSREKYRKVAQRGRARLRQAAESRKGHVGVPNSGHSSEEAAGPTYGHFPHS